jgi:uncharacterized protein (TIGR02391 family)
MNIQNEISIDLWNQVEQLYEIEKFRDVVIQAVLFLTDTIREKANLTSDGNQLITQAFGTESPPIRINEMLTDSQKDEQKGLVNLLYGIYGMIRNPRVHDSNYIDTKASADSILVFIDYVCMIIGRSTVKYDEERFIKDRVFDPLFVSTSEYAVSILSEIPKNARASLLIRLLQDRKHLFELGYLKRRHFFFELSKALSKGDLSRVYKYIDKELQTTTDDDDIISIFAFTLPENWNLVCTPSRLRIEQYLLEDYTGATFNELEDDCGEKGALSSWVVNDFVFEFSNLQKWIKQFIRKAGLINNEESIFV